MGLTRSAEFSKALEETRRMPQGFGKKEEAASETKKRETQGAEKREAARLLRMEALLDNAQCAKLLTTFLEEQPQAGVEDLYKYIQEYGQIIHPESVRSFIETLTKERERASKAFKALMLAGKGKRLSRDLGIRLYQGLVTFRESTGKTIRPKGNISLDSSYPLALILYVQEGEDFERISSNENVGGFYQEFNIITAQNMEDKSHLLQSRA